MRIFGKIIKIILSIVLVFSLILNVLLILSTSDSLVIKDSIDKRLELYNDAYYELMAAKQLTFVNEMVNPDKTHINDTITCELKGETITDGVNCSKITYLYSEDGKLIRTSYFMGDGYKYYVEGENKVKEVFNENENYTYLLSLASGAATSLSYLVLDVSYPSFQENTTYKTTLKFDFNTFSLRKQVLFDYSYNNNKIHYEYEFDGNDRISKIVLSEDYKLEISYKTKSLRFPAFDGFVEK